MTDHDYEILDYPYVAHRIAAGDRIRFIHDFYGGQWIELRHRIFFWDKRRVRLEPDELQLIKDQILARRRAMSRPAAALADIKGAFGARA